MQKMTLGGYTFWRNPDQFDIPRERRYTAQVDTYAGSAFFSWGTFIEGQTIVLSWEWMDETMWDQLQTLLEGDAQIVWDPKDGNTYNVQMTRLDGAYVENALLDAPWRKSVKVELSIRSVV